MLYNSVFGTILRSMPIRNGSLTGRNKPVSFFIGADHSSWTISRSVRGIYNLDPSGTVPANKSHFRRADWKTEIGIAVREMARPSWYCRCGTEDVPRAIDGPLLEYRRNGSDGLEFRKAKTYWSIGGQIFICFYRSVKPFSFLIKAMFINVWYLLFPHYPRLFGVRAK